MSATEPSPPPPEPHPADGLFAARAQRETTVRWIMVITLAAIAWSAWPTATRQLERRAKEFVDASNRGDAKGSYEYVAPSTRQKLSPADWAAQRRARWDVEDVEVAAGGESGVVTMLTVPGKAKVPTRWVRVDGKWFYSPP